MSNLTEVFTSWELTKSLSHQEKIQRVAKILSDKEPDDLTFTAIDSEGNLTKHILGSIEGNLLFLLGFGNPGFHVAPWHYMVMDPNIAEKEATLILEEKGHPSIPRLWLEHGVVPFEEGDLANGFPNPEAFVAPKEDKTFIVNVDGKSYFGNPDTGLVTNVSSGNVYAWSLVRNTYLASQAPELAEKMALEEEAPAEMAKSIPEKVLESASYQRGDEWDCNIYPLVKSLFPGPGSIILVDDGFAVIGASQIDLFTATGEPNETDIWGVSTTSIGLSQENGRGWPSAILSFASKYLKKDIASLEQYIE